MFGIRGGNKVKTPSVKIFLLMIVFLFTCHNAFSFEGPGLYKDGKKIKGFDIVLPQELIEPTEIHTDMKAKQSRLQKFISEHMKEAVESPDKFKEQKEFINIILECKELVEEIKKRLELDEDIGSELESLLQKGEDLFIANREMLRKFNDIKQKSQKKGYSDVIIERHMKMVKKHKEGIRILMDHLNALRVENDKGSLLEKIKGLNTYFLENKFKEDPPFVSGQNMPVNIEKLEAPFVKKGTPIPSEKESIEAFTFSSAPPTQADLDPTIEVQFTEDIIDLANNLNNSPLKIYEYLKNSFEFEPYLGSRKGSQVTLLHRSGNDYDLASLLIALLRVSGIPARYATGIIEMPVDRAKNWLGVEDGATAGSILTTAGMEGVNIISEDEVVAIRCRRVWVEAYIPYTNYRGIEKDDTGKMWIPLDCAFKQYDYHPGIDIPAEMSFDAKAFVDAYISTFHVDSPVEIYKQQIIDYLAVNYPGLTYEDVLRTRIMHPENLGLIPGSLPYKPLTKDGEYSEIPEDKRYKVRFHIYGSGSTLDYTANLPEVAGKQVTISYIGATPEDQQIIDDSGGIFGVAEPWLVHLKPVLKVDGCDMAVGSGEVTMGMTQDSDMHFTQPVGAGNEIPVIYNNIIAGTYQGIGIDTWKVVINLFAPPATSCEESYTGHLLHDTAMKYLGRVDAADEEVNKTMQGVLLNDISEAIVEHVVKVTFSGGNPITFEWSGLRVDADRKIVGPFSVSGDDEGCNYMRLIGADGSISENRLFEDNFNEEAVSTIKILELASDMGIPIYEIDSSSIGTILPLLTVSSSVKSAIGSAVTGGHVVTIARHDITHHDWTGTGYIDMDPTDCAAGYIISGGRSGGETVKEWDIDISQMYCINANITQPAQDAPDSSAVFSAKDESYLIFKADIYPYDANCQALTVQYDKEFSTQAGFPPTPLTVKDIADIYGGGIYTFNAGTWGYTSCSQQCGNDQRKIYIVKADLELFDGVSEDDEEDPGGFIGVNDDNDDKPGNTQLDKDQTTQVVNEDDMKQLKMKVESMDFHEDDPTGITKVTIKRSNINARVWKGKDKSGGPILVNDLRNTWYFPNATSKQKFIDTKDNMWVEGYEPGEVTITIEYKRENDTVIDKDEVKVTVFKVKFSRAGPEDSSGNKYGYDEMTADLNDDHVSVKKNDYTYIKVKIQGFPDASNIEFLTGDENIVKVNIPGSTPAAGFLLKLLGQNKDKAETTLKARIGSNTGPLAAEIVVNVYKEISFTGNYYRVYKAGDDSTKPPVLNETNIANKANKYLKFPVVKIGINAPTEKGIAFDKNDNGKVDYYKNGSNPERDEIYSDLSSVGVSYTDIVLLKDNFIRNWYISSSISIGDTTITVPGTSGLLTGASGSYSVKKPDGSDKETFRIVSISGNTLTIDTDPGTAGNQGFTKAHPLTTDPKTSHTIVDEKYKTAGLGSNITLNRPALVVGATEARVAEIVAHEQMHGQGLSDVNDSTNMMHYTIPSIGNKPFRYKELVRVVTGTSNPMPGSPKDNQWNDLAR